MASLAQSRAIRAAGRDAGRDPRRYSTPVAPTRTETAAAIRAAWRETGDLVDPHTAVAIAVAEHETARSDGAQYRAVDRACGEISRRRAKRLAACGRNCRPGSAG